MERLSLCNQLPKELSSICKDWKDLSRSDSACSQMIKRQLTKEPWPPKGRSLFESIRLFIRAYNTEVYSNFKLNVVCSNGFEILFFQEVKTLPENALDHPFLLASSIQGGRYSIFQFLYNKASISLKSWDYEHFVLIASQHGHVEILQSLLHSSPSVNTLNALISSTSRGHLESVKILLNHSSNPNSLYKDLLVPVAVRDGRAEILTLLLDYGAAFKDPTDGSSLVVAARNGHTEVIKILINREKINVDYSQVMEATPLHYAVQFGHLEAVKVLSQFGASTKKTYGSLTPIGEACSSSKWDIIQYFLDMGLDLNEPQSTHGFTPMMLANSVYIIKLLVEHGADIHYIRPSDGLSVFLHFSSGMRGDTFEILKYFLDSGVDINQSTKAGETALMFATSMGKVKLVEFLLEHGADPGKYNGRGQTASDYVNKKDRRMKEFWKKMENGKKKEEKSCRLM